MSFSVGPPGFGRPTTTSSTSSRSGSRASARSSTARPLSGTSALLIATIRPGTRFGAGAEDVDVHPLRDRDQLLRAQPEVADGVAGAVLARGDVSRDAARHGGLHAQEAVPAAQRDPPQPGGGGEVQVAVDGDGVVDRRDQRQPGGGQPQQRVPEASGCRARRRTRRRGPRAAGTTRWLNVRGSGKPAVHMIANSCRSTSEPNSDGRGRRNGFSLGVQVEAGHLGQRDPRVEVGVGRAGEHLDVVAEVGQGGREVPDVHALTAAVRFAAVGRQRDPQRGVTGQTEPPDDLGPGPRSPVRRFASEYSGTVTVRRGGMGGGARQDLVGAGADLVALGAVGRRWRNMIRRVPAILLRWVP